MYQPLVELSPEGGFATSSWLGEIGGALYGADSVDTYARLGGVKYAAKKFANERVLPWSPSQMQHAAPLKRRLWGELLWGDLAGGVLEWAKGLVLLFLATMVTVVRLVFPTAVSPPSSASGPQGPRDRPEKAVVVAFHTHRMLLAVAVDEGAGACRVVVYDVAAEQEVCTLRHAFQRDVFCMLWKPLSRDTLAVGCKGGVLMWCLSFSVPSRCPAAPTEDSAPSCVFYSAGPHAATTLGFSNCDSRYLVVGSRYDARVRFHDIRLPPTQSLCAQVVSLDGASEQLQFSDDDTFVVQCLSGVKRLALICFPSCRTRTVATTEVVLQAAKTPGMGPNGFALRLAGLEGVLLAHIHPFVGVQIMGAVSTGLYRSVGGAVRAMACSGKRLILEVETGHLVVCHYGRRNGLTVLPVGVATVEPATDMAVFDGFTHGTLLARLTGDDVVNLTPLYHAV